MLMVRLKMLMRVLVSNINVGRVAITDGMDEAAVDLLIGAGHEVVAKHYPVDELLSGVLGGFDAVVVRSATKITSEVIKCSSTTGSSLGFIGRAGVGVDNIDIKSATESGILVCNTPAASTRSVVELTIGHFLASTRAIARADRSLREGKWLKKELKGTEIGGKRLGLVGIGRISKGVAEAARALGMEVHGYDPYVTDPPEWINIHHDIDDLFRTCTHVSVHCNLSAETRNLVNSARISMMPGIGLDGTLCGNHIVSCARGGIVDENAAADALESGQLRSLALDVFETEPLGQSRLLDIDGFHGSPHIAASTLEAQSRIGTEMASLLLEYFDTGDVRTSLN